MQLALQQHFSAVNFVELHRIEISLSQASDNITLPLKTLSNAYTGTIYIDEKPINCIFDTGSTNTWIYHDSLTSFKPIDYSCSIQFGSGKLEGSFGTADIKVGDLVLKNQVFGKVKKTEVFDDEFSCIVGLAFPKMKAGSDWNVPFFDRLMQDHNIY